MFKGPIEKRVVSAIKAHIGLAEKAHKTFCDQADTDKEAEILAVEDKHEETKTKHLEYTVNAFFGRLFA